VLAGDLNCACLEVPAQGERALGSALEHAIEAGEHLRAAKAEIPRAARVMVDCTPMRDVADTIASVATRWGAFYDELLEERRGI
jgi:hypothetical protein